MQNSQEETRGAGTLYATKEAVTTASKNENERCKQTSNSVITLGKYSISMLP